jgi:hypothetical protein
VEWPFAKIYTRRHTENGPKATGNRKKHKWERIPESHHHWGAGIRNEINQKMKEKEKNNRRGIAVSHRKCAADKKTE